jgi:hypothetical protein
MLFEWMFAARKKAARWHYVCGRGGKARKPRLVLDTNPVTHREYRASVPRRRWMFAQRLAPMFAQSRSAIQGRSRRRPQAATGDALRDRSRRGAAAQPTTL